MSLAFSAVKITAVAGLCFWPWLVAAVLADTPKVEAGTTTEPPLQFFTEHAPPGEYLNEQGEVVGATVSLVRLLMQRLNDAGEIYLLPWPRAFAMAHEEPASVLFETVRTPEREALFQWVGPIKQHRISLYGNKSQLPQPAVSEHNTDALLGLVVCDHRNSPYLSQIKTLGFVEGKNLVLTSSYDDCLRLLIRKRIDVMPFSEFSTLWREDELNARGVELQQVFFLQQVNLYLAFSLDVSDRRIARWQQAVQQSYVDGSMRAVYQGIYPEQMILELEQWAQQQP
ncbi:substrate-binding periplasmic protein [Arsukibacterium sp.]|uniref:substrate-binding periplasmic protein n=1 Tax=Arsukibacterium sp. TaxID=1977258 RepID=UPI002FD9B459